MCLVVEYGSVLMMGASISLSSKLNRVQHFAERLRMLTQFKPLYRCCHAAAIGVLRKVLDRNCPEIAEVLPYIFAFCYAAAEISVLHNHFYLQTLP